MRNALSAIRRHIPTNTAFWVAVVNVLLILFFGFLSRNYAFFSAGSFQNILRRRNDGPSFVAPAYPRVQGG